MARFLEDERIGSAATVALVGDRLLVADARFAATQGAPSLPVTV